VEEVLAHDIFNDGSRTASERLPDCFLKLREALTAIAREKSGSINEQEFVDTCTRNINGVLHDFSTSSGSGSNGSLALKELNKSIKPAPILQREARLWLARIRRRIGGKRSVRNPFYVEITRDCPLEIFSVIVRIVRGLDGFVEPFCFLRENNKAIVISFTSMRLVHELFGLLSGFSKDVLANYFKRDFSGARKGHTAAVIVNEVKDFALIYKKRSGKLVIGLNYGEWNVNGFPQHAC
jgi:hypothetical protein